MIRHFFIDKSATIIKGSNANTGLNPIMSLSYGSVVSRGIFHFDEKQIKKWMCEEGISINDDLHFFLKMTNCFSVDGVPYEKKLLHIQGSISERASSFDLVLFRLTKPFDAGRGFDYESDMWNGPDKSYSEEGANWRFCSGITQWDVNGAYESGTEIGTMHFDFGNENINIDITDYVLSIIDGEENNGLGIKFSSDLENENIVKHKVVNFFTDKTNTFFHPVIEAVYDDYIMDDRECCCLGKENRLYLYVNTENGPENLDIIPTCEIDGEDYLVSQARKGVYYIVLSASDMRKFIAPSIIYDEWSNLVMNGANMDNIELETPVLPAEKYVSIGTKSTFKDMTVPSIYGIDFNEKLSRGEIREVVVDFRRKYTTDKKELTDYAQWTLYVKSGTQKITVFDYQPVEKAFLNNFFIIHTEDLIPGEYFVDIKNIHGRETRYYKEVLKFEIISDEKERYN